MPSGRQPAASLSRRDATRKCLLNVPNLSAILAVTLVIIVSSAISSQATAIEERTSVTLTQDGVELGEQLTSEQQLMISTRLPRQHFRLHVMQPARKSTFKTHRVRNPTNSSTSTNALATTSTTKQSDAQTIDNDIAPPAKKTPLPKGPGKKISSAVLRKLLNQTLPKLNATSSMVNSTTSRGPHFKLVFIQRGSGNTTTSQPMASTPGRQLASSLFYTAANLVGNLTSPATSSAALVPSTLTALSSSLAQSFAPTAPANQSGHDGSSLVSAESGDSKRILGQPQVSKSKLMTRTRKPRPSKIYNLPVKFVANGQPNQVMLHSIKHHFATIKRLQQAAVSGQQALGTSNKRKKTHQGAADRGTRLRGKNSRLIYLPLKFLSNAKPNMLNVVMAGATKASHKSAASTTAIVDQVT